MSNFLKRLVVGLFSLTFVLLAFQANAYVNVNGYYKANGTYVAPYVRSNPNGLKYDNYGYTPSQGLYNSTYGTRGSTWDTPTYTTDQDYYTGQSLYNSGKSGNYYSNSSYSTPSCPVMSSYNSISKTCECYSGYSVDTDYLGKETCVSNVSKCQKLNGYNSTYNSLTKKCECSYGYIYSGSECVSTSSYCRSLIGLMSNYNSLTNTCECLSGYELIGSNCTYKSKSYYDYSNLTSTCTLNASLNTDGKCYCDSGYTISADKTTCQKTECNSGYVLIGSDCLSYNDVCKKAYGSSYGDKNYCYCNDGYKWNDGKTSCIKKEDNILIINNNSETLACGVNSTAINNQCVCNWPYKLYGGECSLLGDFEKKFTNKIDVKLSNKLSGYILSQNEQDYVLWWVNPDDKSRYQLDSSTDLMNLIQKKAKMYDSKSVVNLKNNPSKVLGKFIIDKTNWLYYYVNPKDKKFYIIIQKTDGYDDYNDGLVKLRKFAIGITNNSIRTIKVGN